MFYSYQNSLHLYKRLHHSTKQKVLRSLLLNHRYSLLDQMKVQCIVLDLQNIRNEECDFYENYSLLGNLYKIWMHHDCQGVCYLPSRIFFIPSL
mmetsp:Transcript_50639/g.99031  ORF Transcript_50639/g.99031 Transcript_50639/m.99031 type:complete len:94 (+) Transcript_50639:207-488(+)